MIFFFQSQIRIGLTFCQGEGWGRRQTEKERDFFLLWKCFSLIWIWKTWSILEKRWTYFVLGFCGFQNKLYNYITETLVLPKLVLLVLLVLLESLVLLGSFYIIESSNYVQNAFWQSGSESRWFLKNLMARKTPHPLHGKCHFKFPFF